MRNSLQSIIAVLMGMILLGFVLVGFSGCADEEILQPLDYISKVKSNTPERLMENFALAYGKRDLEMYAQLLNEDFLYTFHPDSAKRLGPSYKFFTREDELITAKNMFSGEPVVNSRGQIVAAITDIKFVAWQQSGAWQLTGEMDKEGGLRGVFDCVVQFTREGDSDITIRGQQLFTVVPAEISDEEDGIEPNYQIIGWQDLTAK
jgi:hypothetical protein